MRRGAKKPGPALRRGTVAVVLGMAMSVAAAAGPIEDIIVSQLQKQGFRDIDVSRTLLGRGRIVARSDDVIREIIVNRSTGEILRDYSENLGKGSRFGIVDPGRSHGSGGNSDDDNSDDENADDDNGDDDRDDDNSGDDSGDDSDNSGSGNNGSGGGGDDD
jgi:hypothetical protein